MKLETLLVKLGDKSKESGGCVNPPVYRASTLIFHKLEDFSLAKLGKHKIKSYGRYGTEGTKILEETIAKIEGADKAITTASGASAYAVALSAVLNAGDHILMPDNVYSPARDFADRFLKRMNVETDYYDPRNTGEMEKMIKPNTKVIYIESPGSLSFETCNIPEFSKVCKKHNIILMADTTWSALINMRPFEIGIDITVYSATKYISGHSDLFMGVIGCREEFFKKIEDCHHDIGSVPSGDNCYLALRGLKTMAIRLERHERSALKIAKFLEKHPKVKKVFYPALESNECYEDWKRDFNGACGLFSFSVDEYPREKLSEFFDNMELFSMGLSWGGFESLLIPVYPKEHRVKMKDIDGLLFRIHVGLEDPDDLIEDLEKSFDRLG